MVSTFSYEEASVPAKSAAATLASGSFDYDAAAGKTRGNVSRGFEVAARQIPQTLGGVVALAGDAMRQPAIRDFGLNTYQRQADAVAAQAQPSDSFSNVLEGDGNVGDFLGYGAGYVGGQAVQALATGGVGGLVGRQIARRGIANVVGDQAAQRVARGQTRGAVAALSGMNLQQEAGSIYPEALETARAEGRDSLTPAELGRVGAAALLAAGVETAADATMLRGVFHGASGAPTLARRALRTVPAGMTREGLTEVAQTGIERAGAGQELTGEEATRDYIDSAALGALGGGMGGAASAVRREQAAPAAPPPAVVDPQDGPVSRAVALLAGPGTLTPGEPVVVDGTGAAMSPAQAARQRLQEEEATRQPEGDFRNQARAVQPPAPPFVAAEPVEPAAEVAPVLQLQAPAIEVDAAGTATTTQQRNARAGAPAPPAEPGPRETGAIGLGRNSEQVLPELRRLQAPAVEVGADGTATTSQQRDAQARQRGADAEVLVQQQQDENARRSGLGLDLLDAEGNILDRGQPFRTRIKAQQAARRNGPGFEAVQNPTGSGFVVRRQQQDVTDVEARPASAAGAASAVQTSRADDVERAAAVDLAAHEAASSPHNERAEPTDAQKEAGNYAKGHVPPAQMHGLDVTIETPRGALRRGKRPDGSTWEHEMSDHYGYIRRTKGADGEQVDAYIGPGGDEVFVVDQLDQQTGEFDEHKVMLDYPDQASATSAYSSNFDKGWKVGPVTRMTVPEFKKWLKDADLKKPASKTFTPAAVPGAQPAAAATAAPAPGPVGAQPAGAAAPAAAAPAAVAPPAAARPNKVAEGRAKKVAKSAAKSADSPQTGAAPSAAAPAENGESGAPAAKKPLTMGVTPGAAEPVTVRAGTIYVGNHQALDFESGEPIKAPAGATDADLRKALKDAGVLSTRQRFFGGQDALDEAAPRDRLSETTPGGLTVREVRERIAAMRGMMTVPQVQAAADRLTKGWKGTFEVRVVATSADLPGRKSNARGRLVNGVGYIVADKHRTVQDVGRTLAHEVIAHYGLRAALGRMRWTRLMTQIREAGEAGNKDVLAARDIVQRAYRDAEGEYLFKDQPEIEADEVAARLIEGAVNERGEMKPGLEWLKWVWAKLARFLRDTIGLKVRFTTAELHGIFVEARKNLEDGDRPVPAGLAISPAAQDARADKSLSVPDAIIGANLGAATKHPDYAEAKGGDTVAAVRLAQDLVTDDMVAKLRKAIGSAKPLVVPVIAEEASGRNRIPLATAEVLAQKLGLETTTEIVQANRARRTGMDGLDRIFASVDFAGDVQPGDYLLVDDTLTQGGTFASLASHIEAGGGRVVGVVALTGKQYSAKIQADPATLTALRQKHGDLEDQFRAATGHGFDALTQSEARYLANFEPAQRLRDRIAEEGRRGGERADEGAPEEGRDARDDVAAPFSPNILDARDPGASYGPLSADQEAALRNLGGLRQPETLKQQWQRLTQNLGTRIKQGVVDQFAPIQDLANNASDPKAAEAAQRAYMLARLSKGAEGTMEAALLYGKPFLRDGVPDVKVDEGGFAGVLAKLQGEHDRFLWWVAAQRAERLKREGRENLFTDQDIGSLKTLADGKMADGADRRQAYAKALADLNAFNDAVLEVAEGSGLIDADARQLFKDQPYVPFYRVMEDEGAQGPRFSSGLVNQKAWKKLKGGSGQLNQDLLENMLLNWAHLYTAAARNRAAVAAMDAAEQLAIAHETNADAKGSVRVMRDGVAHHYQVEDPFLLEAITALHYTPSPLMAPLAKMKRLLTFAVTVNPAFKVRNLLRDSVSAMANADLSYNPMKNVVQGWKSAGPKSQTYASMLASGGVMRFGSQEDTARVRHKIEKLGGRLADEKAMHSLKSAMASLWDAYNDLGDRTENVNRAALYDQLVAKGHSHAEASFMARDLMDFSMSGQWPVVRFLTQTVPFLNARLQGLYKLGRAAKEDPARFAAITGAVALASLALMAMYAGDEDWEKREDWDRDNYWWFKVGDTAYRIPKPFEVGAIGTMAERTAELFFSKEMTGERFRDRLAFMLGQTFSLNPVPQAFSPLFDVYSNRDSFRRRPIESQADEKMRPEDRYDERTSEIGRLLGRLQLPEPVSLLKGEYRDLSPKQWDFLLQGYLSWVGSTIAMVTGHVARPLLDRGERPDRRPGVGFMQPLPPGGGRYVTQFYEQARDIEQAYASYRAALREGDTQKAGELAAEGAVRNHLAANRVRQRMDALGTQARAVERNRLMSGEEKRRRLDEIDRQRGELATAYVRRQNP